MRGLQDPKAVLADFEAALPVAPPWLRPKLDADHLEYIAGARRHIALPMIRQRWRDRVVRVLR